jgi:hypothetical protein
MFTMANISHPHLDQVTGPQLAVQPQVEHREFSNAVLQLKANPNRPNLFQLKRGLLPNDDTLVPRGMLCVFGDLFHDGLLIN